MILYRKQQGLRIRRETAPQPPFWCATAIAPYSARRAGPVAVDYLASRASASERLEVAVCEDVRDELDRVRPFDEPVLIDAAGQAEAVFRRGDDALAWCHEQGRAALYLTSTHGVLPHQPGQVVIAAWPLEPERLEELFSGRFGVVVPVLYPVTTELEKLEDLADRAQKHGASFLAALPVTMEATARQALAQALDLSGDDDRYAMLFHADVEPIHLATERHIAALAAERGLPDFVLPPKWSERSNWNASTLLALTASRMIAMELDLDLAGSIARSARLIAGLDKPVTRVAESASLSIIGGLDETSAEMLTQWLAGETPSFAEYVNEQWRLPRARPGA